MNRAVIGDVHGAYKTLMALVAQLPTGTPITFVGDLVDRALDSSKVIKFVRENGHDCVMGNHEVMMIDELQFKTLPDGTERPFADEEYGIWLMNGGDTTLYSYKLDEINAFGETVKASKYDTKTLKEDVEWLKTLPYFLEYKDLVDDKGQHLLVTHSTAAEVWGECATDSKEFIDNVTWERISYPSKINGIYNVFGHTPQQYKPTVKGHFANIDTGACFKRAPYGRMTALLFPSMEIFTQDNVEDNI